MSYTHNALYLHAIGLLPLPVIDKQPCVGGFNKWRHMKEETIEKFQEQFPDAELALLTRASGVIVVDIDDGEDPSLVSWAMDEFGYTPLHVKTRRGYHLYFKNPDNITGRIGNGKYPIDVKGAGKSDYVVMPPSPNYTFGQTFLDSSPKDLSPHEYIGFLELLREVPAINPMGLLTFFPKHPFLRKHPELGAVNDNNKTILEQLNAHADIDIVEGSIGAQDEARVPLPILTEGCLMPDGQRNRWLFDEAMSISAKLAKQQGTGDTVFGLLRNETFERNQKFCETPLPAKEVEKLVQNVWFNYELKGKNRKHKSHEEMMMPVEITASGITQGLSDPYAYWFLMWLNSHYDETLEFGLNEKSLTELTGLSVRKFRNAKTYLLENNYIILVRPHDRNNNRYAYFAFTDKSHEMFTRISTDIKDTANDNNALPEQDVG